MLKKITNIFILIIFFFIDFIIKLGEKRIEKDEKRELLLIEFSNIGDFVLKLGSIKKMKENQKTKKIDLICDISCKKIAQKTEYFDEIIAVDRRKFLRKLIYRYQILKKLKKLNYEIIINLFYSRNIFSDDWIIKNITSEKKIGLIGDNINSNFYMISNKWYTQLIETPKKKLFETERTNLLVKKILNLKFENEYSDISNLFNEKFELSKNFVVIFLGASNLKRAYPLEKMAEVLKKIPPEIDLIFCGTKPELKLYEDLKKIVKFQNKTLNLIGKTTLIESINIIKNSRFLIGNDSGPVHIASALKKKSICILGGGMNIGRFFPYKFSDRENYSEEFFLPRVIYEKKECFGCGWRCKYKTKTGETWPCIADISLKKIQDELEKIIKDGTQKC